MKNFNKKNHSIKTGDYVEVISGKYKGKQGKVICILNKKEYLTIEGINLKTKHNKPQKTDEKGKIKKKEGPIHHSNIKLIQ
uniref:Large ribosomal subunit protein uL24c n=1 Tax=Cliftonaea pectinata TaxID=2007206 RepID=A0A1Z1MQL3_9FLOR|nr:ribosomal protein L24 [Cliftonaea pectinata]ARW68142.1 ribosomal protein L24 [Cliftonaea pectinata]